MNHKYCWQANTTQITKPTIHIRVIVVHSFKGPRFTHFDALIFLHIAKTNINSMQLSIVVTGMGGTPLQHAPYSSHKA